MLEKMAPKYADRYDIIGINVFVTYTDKVLVYDCKQQVLGFTWIDTFTYGVWWLAEV